MAPAINVGNFMIWLFSATCTTAAGIKETEKELFWKSLIAFAAAEPFLAFLMTELATRWVGGGSVVFC